MRPPGTTADRVFLALAALFPAVACIAGAAILSARLRHSKRAGNDQAVEQADEAVEARSVGSITSVSDLTEE
jgi:hypothetical protein